MLADGGYISAPLAKMLLNEHGIALEARKRNRAVSGFEVVKQRWVVERSFAWLNKYRGMSKDYEYLVSSSAAMVYIASLHRNVRYLTRSD